PRSSPSTRTTPRTVSIRSWRLVGWNFRSERAGSTSWPHASPTSTTTPPSTCGPCPATTAAVRKGKHRPGGRATTSTTWSNSPMLDPPFEEIRAACAHLHARGLLAAADGNVSVRLADDTLLLTPAGVNKARLKAGSLARVALDGRILEGRPSTERAMHLAIYRACPEARAVVHAHPPTAIAWTLARPQL